MDHRKNNIFVAFALWAGVWNLLRIVEYLSFELYMSVRDKTAEYIPVSLDEWPMLAGFLAVAIVARAWRGNTSLLILIFAALDIIWAILAYADTSVYSLLCPREVCTWEFSHDFHVWTTFLEFLGYIFAAIMIQAIRIVMGTEWLTFNNRNPLDYIARIMAHLIAKLGAWLEVDGTAIANTWRRWAALPLWRSGTFLTRSLGYVWVPFFGLAAASILASRIVQTLAPFWNMVVVGDIGGEGTWGIVAIMLPLFLVTLAVSWAVGRFTAELEWAISAWAAVAATLLAAFSIVEVSIRLLTMDNTHLPDLYLIFLQNIGSVVLLYIGFIIGHRRALGRGLLANQN